MYSALALRIFSVFKYVKVLALIKIPSFVDIVPLLEPTILLPSSKISISDTLKLNCSLAEIFVVKKKFKKQIEKIITSLFFIKFSNYYWVC